MPLEVWASLYGFTYIDHYWLTTKPIMLNDTGSIMFATASLDSLISVVFVQGEPALICEKHREPVLVFYAKCQSGPHEVCF